jgi:hypothetical protein
MKRWRKTEQGNRVENGGADIMGLRRADVYHKLVAYDACGRAGSYQESLRLVYYQSWAPDDHPGCYGGEEVHGGVGPP